MSASFDMVAYQARQVEQLAACFSGCAVVLETNKRSIVRCPNHGIAKQLASQLSSRNYCVAVKQGRKSSLFYVRAFLNQFPLFN